MRVVVAHNRYQQPGGEDEVYAAETRLLERHGHEVHRYAVDNDGLDQVGRLALARDTVWNARAYRAFGDLVRRVRPHVAHFHNTLPRISPAAYYAAARQRVPVVQTVHNYRLVCPSALLFRDGRPCHDCVGSVFGLPGVRHACYRGSRAATAAVAGMTATHRLLGTWSRRVTLYVALTEFARDRLVEGGFAPERIVVKPNFVDPDPGPGTGAGGYALFVGRLVPEKGVRTLLRAWRTLGHELPLRIVGDGPLAGEVEAAVRELPNVHWLGRRTPEDTAALIGEAACLVCPSEWYETFGRVVTEAFAAGTPVVASRIGALAELVHDGHDGRLFRPGDADELAGAVRAVAGADGARRADMRRAARDAFTARYGAARNYEALVAIYERAMALEGARGGSRAGARAVSA